MADHDVIVVGGGTAGCVVASRLVRAGFSVLLVEAGPDYGRLDAGRWPDELLDAASLPTTHDWGYHGFGAGGQLLPFDRAKVLGGCSSHNGCTQSIGWTGDYDRLPGEWNAAALAPHIAAAEQMMQLRTYARDEIQPFHVNFLASCAEAGLPIANDFLDLDGGIGAGCAPVNTVGNTRINTAFAYLDAVRDVDGLTIAPDSSVHRLLWSGSRVEGVEYRRDGELRRARARTVVVSAGTYGTPEVLLRSGVGPASDLRALGISVQAPVSGVGRNLHDHPTVQLTFEASTSLAAALGEFGAHRWLPEEQTMAKLRSPYADGPYDLHVYPWVEPDDAVESGWRVVIPVSQLRPRSRGSLTLRSADPTAQSIVEPNFFGDEAGADLASVRYGLEWITDVLLQGSLTGSLGTMIGRDPRRMDGAELDRWIRETHSHYWHPAGTARMGNSDESGSVIDSNGCVFGVDGLYVADASVFPDIPRATPAFPTVVVAERIASVLVSTLSGSAPKLVTPM